MGQIQREIPSGGVLIWAPASYRPHPPWVGWWIPGEREPLPRGEAQEAEELAAMREEDEPMVPWTRQRGV